MFKQQTEKAFRVGKEHGQRMAKDALHDAKLGEPMPFVDEADVRELAEEQLEELAGDVPRHLLDYYSDGYCEGVIKEVCGCVTGQGPNDHLCETCEWGLQ